MNKLLSEPSTEKIFSEKLVISIILILLKSLKILV
jgi:hypothetical protein